MKKHLLTLAALPLIAAGTTAAHAETYTVDASHTNILVSVSHIGFSNMVLEALHPVGTLEFDQTSPESSKINIVMKATNIDGDDEKFNHHLHSADLFNAEKFPEITFNSTSVDVTGENTGKVTGDFTLLGVTKPLTLDVTFNKLGANPFSGKETVGFTATGTLKRSDFGMGYGLPAIGDDITVNINLEANK